jgi:serine/threonine protein kinase
MPLTTGQILNNRYRIVKLLGQGGFGAVYRAWDMNLKRAFALKENLELSPESVRQFQREASFLAELHHPNLPRVIDCFSIAGQGQYLVMDFIEGDTLWDKFTRAGGRLPESQVIPWVGQVCDALTFLHTQNPPVIHRDIKPANIKITPEGQVMLVDFGIAKAYFGQAQTTVGARAVTEGYSPPEQYGHGITDGRSDIYALGATVYHMLTGETPVESVKRHLGVGLVPPRTLNPAISIRTEAVILQAMELDMASRFQHAQDFKSALSAPVSVLPPAGVGVYGDSLDDTLIALPQPVPPPVSLKAPVSAKRSRPGMIIVAGVVAAILCILGTLGGVFVYLKGTATPTAEPTRVTATQVEVVAVPTLTPLVVPDEPEIEPTLTPSPQAPPPRRPRTAKTNPQTPDPDQHPHGGFGSVVSLREYLCLPLTGR